MSHYRSHPSCTEEGLHHILEQLSYLPYLTYAKMGVSPNCDDVTLTGEARKPRSRDQVCEHEGNEF